MKKKNSSKIALKKAQQRDSKRARRLRINVNKLMKAEENYYWVKL